MPEEVLKKLREYAEAYQNACECDYCQIENHPHYGHRPDEIAGNLARYILTLKT